MAYGVLDKAQEPGRLPRAAQLLGPRSVCGAFAVEVYVKCILADNGAPIPQKHDLVLLFSNIPRAQRQKLSSLWKAHGNSGAIEDSLKPVATAFEDWRYVFERPVADLDDLDFGPLHKLFREFILSLHPQWSEGDPQFVLPTSPTP